MKPNQHAFVAIYAGETVTSARLIVASADQTLVQYVADRLLHTSSEKPDAILNALEEGRRTALRLLLNKEGNDHA